MSMYEVVGFQFLINIHLKTRALCAFVNISLPFLPADLVVFFVTYRKLV